MFSYKELQIIGMYMDGREPINVQPKSIPYIVEGILNKIDSVNIADLRKSKNPNKHNTTKP